MCSCEAPISFGLSTGSSRTPFRNPAFIVDVHKTPTVMWRNAAKQISSRGRLNCCRNLSLSVAHRYLGLGQDSVFSDEVKFRRLLEPSSRSNVCFPVLGFREKCGIKSIYGPDELGSPHGRNQLYYNGLGCRCYASVAEAVEVLASHTDLEEDNTNIIDVSVPDEVQQVLSVMRKEERRQYSRRWRRQRNIKLGDAKNRALRKRQVKIETEAWQQAAKEYAGLLNDMCEQKLAPNLPYMKSLFLGWFEPLRNRIAEEQEFIRAGKSKAAYAKYFDLLPADMMAVITMHKLTGLLMSGGEHGCARVVQAACIIGDAIEQEVRINYFLEKSKKKKTGKAVDESDATTEDQGKLRTKVTTLIKKQKLRAARQIVNRQIESQPWGQDARAKVGSHLIELILQTAYIQPPADQLAEGPPDIRPAFLHTSRTLSKENK